MAGFSGTLSRAEFLAAFAVLNQDQASGEFEFDLVIRRDVE